VNHIRHNMWDTFASSMIYSVLYSYVSYHCLVYFGLVYFSLYTCFLCFCCIIRTMILCLTLCFGLHQLLLIMFGHRFKAMLMQCSLSLSVCWPDCKPEGPLFSAEFVCESVGLSVCLCVCVSLTGTSTLQR